MLWYLVMYSKNRMLGIMVGEVFAANMVNMSIYIFRSTNGESPPPSPNS